MNKPIKLTFLLILACLMLLPVNAQNTPEWQSQYAVGLNKLAPHTYVWPYASATDVKKGDYEQSPYYLNLNGKWKFHWVKNPDLRPKDFYKPSFYTGGWADINVPGNWERQGYGTAIYVNETYEFDDKMFNFKKNPPLVPYKENEVGSYRRTFTVPAGWKGRRVVLCCEGVISFYYVWVNGHFLGYNQGSKTAAEWDITDQLEEGENTIALEVYRWSSGSYLECQDMWRLSGIERDVYLYSTPKQYIADYKVNATLEKERYKDGIFGLDVTVGWQDKIKDFSYGARFNLSDQKDKLVDYGVEYNGFVAGVNQKVQGYSLGSIFGYRTDGYFTSEEEVKNSAAFNKAITGVGDIKYIDKDGDGKISAPNDLEYLGTTTPRYTFGLNLTAAWKGFDLGVLLQGVGKRNFYLSSEVMNPYYATWNNFSYKMHNDYWTPENPNAAFPRYYAGANHNYQISDHWLQNAAYVRLKNLQLGYTISPKLTKSWGIQRLRVYFSGDNLCEYSKLNDNFDPELSDINGYVYPIMRNFSFGINVTL